MVLDDYDVFLPSELKATFYFKPGSYWIYYETGTGFSDSIWVVSARLDTLPILHKGSLDTLGYKETLQVTYQSIFFGSRFRHITESDENCAWFGGNACHWVIRANLNGAGNVTTSARIMGYPFKPMSYHPLREGGHGDQTIQLDSLFGQYRLDSSTFNNVHLTRINIDPTQQNAEAHRYFAHSIGVIRRHLPLGNIDWRLVRYKVVQ